MKRVALLLSGLLLAGTDAFAGVPAVIPPPEGARVVDFDDVFPAPDVFANATALTDRYAPVGVVFAPDVKNGPAVLDQSSGFSVTGYSPPNFLAFNSGSLLSDDGIPELPATLQFRHPVRYLQFNVGSFFASTVTATGYDDEDNPVASIFVNATAEVQTLVLEGPRMARVVITTTGSAGIIDDLAFVLDSTRVDFDDVASAPISFANANALRDHYAALGVSFTSLQNFDGGAILGSGSGFSVSGYSAPNFLAFNANSALQDGGKPKLPEYLLFAPLVRHVDFRAADSGGSTLTVTAYDSGGGTLDTQQVTLASAMKTVSIDAPGIATLKLESNGTLLVLDDLDFDIEGTMIDFDDLAPAPSFFINTTALRNRYQDLGVWFRGPGKNGGAILDKSSGFSVSGYSGSNYLAFNTGLSMSDGGTPSMPQTLLFARPARRVDLRVADPDGTSRIFVEGFDANDQSTGTNDVYATPALQSLPLPGDGTVRLEITTDGPFAVIDDVAVSFTDACAHDICRAGDPLDRNCDSCAQVVCAANSDCCNDSWTTSCAKSVSELCEVVCLPICGDANDDRRLTATDALLALKTAVGSGSCPPARCDFNNDTKILAADALQILRTAVGLATTPKCPKVLL